ncbi:hypothetical protein [Shewanella surugensis]|uniref:Uncharacterized protein n=1 Tax=Shewanella surugensis TaxID=212020 RepID=A0ABT0LC07_9GAMM|nr:hypothetical protein [Shewanella surugensis]MCL1125237.1 hypothetical protein [Shewanella surugensis]
MKEFSNIIEIICPNKLKLTPTGMKSNHFYLNKTSSQLNSFICPLCREQHHWSEKDVVDY